MRWNALVMVVRANYKAYGELGGHTASYASRCRIFETGFNHFFRARTERAAGVSWFSFSLYLVWGFYSRPFLEGRLERRANW